MIRSVHNEGHEEQEKTSLHGPRVLRVLFYLASDSQVPASLGPATVWDFGLPL